MRHLLSAALTAGADSLRARVLLTCMMLTLGVWLLPPIPAYAEPEGGVEAVVIPHELVPADVSGVLSAVVLAFYGDTDSAIELGLDFSPQARELLGRLPDHRGFTSTVVLTDLAMSDDRPDSERRITATISFQHLGDHRRAVYNIASRHRVDTTGDRLSLESLDVTWLAAPSPVVDFFLVLDQGPGTAGPMLMELGTYNSLAARASIHTVYPQHGEAGDYLAVVAIRDRLPANTRLEFQVAEAAPGLARMRAPMRVIDEDGWTVALIPLTLRGDREVPSWVAIHAADAADSRLIGLFSLLAPD